MIEVQNLSKHFKIEKKKPGILGNIYGLFNREYEIKTAVDDVNFQINKGELVGYIGPNGAGKSTTIKMLCGVLYPDCGTVLVNGNNPFNDRKKNNMNIGVVFGQRSQLWIDLAVQESLVLLKKIYRVTDREYNERIEILDEVLGIKEFLTVPVRKLSLGQKMRCEFAASLIHWPDVLYLDEPTIGVDIMVRKKILQFIKWLNEEYNKTIILTTHNMQDVETLCKRVILLNKGSIIFDGQIDKLKENYGDFRKVRLNFLNDINFDPDSIMKKFKEMYLKLIEFNQSTLVFETKTTSNITQMIDLINKHQAIQNFEVNVPNIDDIIENIYSEEKITV